MRSSGSVAHRRIRTAASADTMNPRAFVRVSRRNSQLRISFCPRISLPPTGSLNRDVAMIDPIFIVYGLAVMALFCLFQALSLMTGESGVSDAPSIRRKTLADGFSPWLADLVITRQVRDFESLIASSGIPFSAMQVLIAIAVVTLVVTAVFTFLGSNPALSAGYGVVIGAAAPLLIIRQVRHRRMAKLVSQLPDALDMLVRSLRVGHPVPIGIGMIGSEMPSPIGGEFKRVYDSMSYGLDLKDALEHMSSRLQVAELTYMVAAIRIQFATGGNLSEVLASLSSVMRERVRLRMKVRATTAETRFSATVMSVVPFLLIGGIYLIKRDFY